VYDNRIDAAGFNAAEIGFQFAQAYV